jgi:DNA polymerase III epsilon subunit-like protein
VGLFDGATVVAHNALFEQSFLEGLLEGVPVLDSCELALILFPELRSHALALSHDVLVLVDGHAHVHSDALRDSLCDCDVARLCLERLALGRQPLPLAALHGDECVSGGGGALRALWRDPIGEREVREASPSVEPGEPMTLC